MIDDDLILFHYRDGLPATRLREIETQLQRDPKLAARYAALVAELGALPPAQPVRASATARQRWAHHLDLLAERESRTRPARTRQLTWQLAGGFALLLVGVGVGLRLGERVPSLPEPSPPPTIAAVEHSPLVRAVQAHLNLTGTWLAELPEVDAQARRVLIAEVVTQNRVYERSAQHQNADKLARVLRAMEPVLLSLADESADEEAFAASLRQLEFELTVMQTKLAQAPSNAVRRS